ncbi:MAG: ATP synthase F0 subunit B [Gemmatimonadetes bacterium]|nr:ATP synthase F0 subunit B [Gemmatimonadota bacterium]
MHSFLLMVQEGAEAAQHAAGAPASPFEVNFGLFFWTWLVFGGLVLVLWKFAWPPILKATEERERKIKLQLEEAERLNAEAKASAEELRRQLAAAHEQASALLNEAKQAAHDERELAVKKTREEQDHLLDRARKEIQSEKERAIVSLRREAVDLSLAAASKLLEEEVDTEANRKLVTDYLANVPEMKH